MSCLPASTLKVHELATTRGHVEPDAAGSGVTGDRECSGRGAGQLLVALADVRRYLGKATTRRALVLRTGVSV